MISKGWLLNCSNCDSLNRTATEVMWGVCHAFKMSLCWHLEHSILTRILGQYSFWPHRCGSCFKPLRVQVIGEKHSVFTLQVWRIPTKKSNKKPGAWTFTLVFCGWTPTSFEDMMIPNPHVHVSSCHGFYLPKSRMCLGQITCIHRIWISCMIIYT